MRERSGGCASSRDAFRVVEGENGLVKDRTGSRLAWVAFGFVAFCFVGGFIFSIRSGSAVEPFEVAMLSFPVVGILVAARQPRNAIGWIMLGIGLVSALAAVLNIYSSYALDIRPGSLPRPDLAVALNEPMWIPFIAPIGTFLILLFPNGRLPSPRWRAWAWLCAIAMSLSFVGILIAPGSFAETGYPDIENPLGIEALRPLISILSLVIILIPISIVGCAFGLVQRFRRSSGQERLQLKWLAAAASVVATVYAVLLALRVPFGFLEGDIPHWVDVVGDFGIFVFVLIPLAIAVAILKHRLYDIDLIIKRTLVYGALTAVLSLVYFGGVVGVGGLVRDASGRQDNSLVTAGTTLVVAALFHPARARIQCFIDRRFFRRRYDAAQAIETFSARLRDEIDLETLSTELVAVVENVMQPTKVALWLREPQRQPVE
ncbi:hypothetical protein BH24ACT26_BH24ACT26_01930 [soil metagenome]